MIDIGCNKGYTSSVFFGLWASDLQLSPATLQQRRPDVPCGICGDCVEQVKPSKTDPASRINVYCVEPNLVNFANLVLTRELFLDGSKPNAQWHLISAAMSNSSAFVRFPRCPAGREDCFIGDPREWAGFDEVPMRTVDELIQMYNIEHINILKTDTEGHDPAVLSGAMGAFKRGIVDMYTFEYHGLGPWLSHKLEDVVALLDSHGMTCYFDAKPMAEGSLWRLTGCWDPSYEAHAWSNVACVRRDHPMYPHMERMSTRYNKYKDLYFQKNTR